MMSLEDAVAIWCAICPLRPRPRCVAAVSVLVLLLLLLKLPLLLLLLLQARAGRQPAGEAAVLTCGFAWAMPWTPEMVGLAECKHKKCSGSNSGSMPSCG